jgi:outer membrane protein assembly factor BamB
VNKIFYLLSILILITGCSLYDSGGFWSKEKKINKKEIKFKPVFEKVEIISKEFNSDFELSLNKNEFKINNYSYYDNNDGYNLFNGNLKKIKKYSFSKIKNFYRLEPHLTFYNKNIIFFDNKGSILNFDQNSKLIWKSNNYSKEEKKIGPLISISQKNNLIIAADNLGNFYGLNAIDGKKLWLKKNDSSFNSQIKIFKNFFFVLDVNNSLHCFSVKDGSKLWSFFTEESFINSNKILSMIIKNEKIIFTNSLGDITALDINDGKLLWQTSTLKSRIFEDIMKLNTSTLVESEDSIYFSNNLGNFYSIDLDTGSTNWIQKINSSIKPTIIKNLIFTISDDGFLFVIEKNTGNIIRVTNLSYQSSFKKINSINPIGFILNSNNLFVSTKNGNLLIVSIKTGKIDNILKIDKGKISRGFILNQNMYLIKDNSIIKIN